MTIYFFILFWALLAELKTCVMSWIQFTMPTKYLNNTQNKKINKYNTLTIIIIIMYTCLLQTGWRFKDWIHLHLECMTSYYWYQQPFKSFIERRVHLWRVFWWEHAVLNEVHIINDLWTITLLTSERWFTPNKAENQSVNKWMKPLRHHNLQTCETAPLIHPLHNWLVLIEQEYTAI